MLDYYCIWVNIHWPIDHLIFCPVFQMAEETQKKHHLPSNASSIMIPCRRWACFHVSVLKMRRCGWDIFWGDPEVKSYQGECLCRTQSLSLSLSLNQCIYNIYYIYIYILYSNTLLGTNIAPENGWLEDSFPFGMVSWQVRTVSFREIYAPYSAICRLVVPMQQV